MSTDEVIKNRSMEESDKNARWHNLITEAEATKAGYLARFEGRSMSEKYRLVEKRMWAARAEKLEERKK